MESVVFCLFMFMWLSFDNCGSSSKGVFGCAGNVGFEESICRCNSEYCEGVCRSGNGVGKESTYVPAGAHCSQRKCSSYVNASEEDDGC